MSGKKKDSDAAAIRKLDAAWDKAARAKDIDRVITFYSKQGSVVWPENEAAKGHKAIRARWTQAYKDTPNLWLEFKPLRIDIASGRDFAVDFGMVHFAPHVKKGDGNIGKYLVVWKREKDGWKVLYDSYNMDTANNPVK